MKSLNNKYLFKLLLGICFIGLALCSCNRRPHKVLDQKKMINILTDLYIMDAAIKNHASDFGDIKDLDAYMKGVMAKHGTTKQRFDSSLVWYSDNITELTKLNESVTERLSKIDSFYSKKKATAITYKFNDLRNNLPKSYILDPLQTSFAFRIDSTLIKKEGDVKEIFWNFETIGICQKQNIEASIYYKLNDTLIVEKKSLLQNGEYSFSYKLPTDSLGDTKAEFKSVAGYVHLNSQDNSYMPIVLNKIKLEFIK